MKILFVTWNFPPKVGGMETMLYEIWKQLRKAHEVAVIGPYADSKRWAEERIYTAPRDGLAFFLIWASVKGIQLLVRQRFDLILAGSALLSPLVVLLSRCLGTKSSSYVYGLDLVYPHWLYQKLISTSLPRLDLLVAISTVSRDMAIKKGTDDGKIEVICPGIDFARFDSKTQPERSKRDYSLSDQHVILSVGRLVKRKGILEFIRYAMPIITHAVPDTVFVVAGGNPTDALAHKRDMHSLIEAEVAKQRLKTHVRLMGRVDQHTLIELYHLCDLFVLPAIPVVGDMEGFGIVLIEAGAAGKPVVATRVGGIVDAVEDGRSGILVEPGDYVVFSREIISLLRDPARRQEMGEYGRWRAQEQFNWDVIGERYIELFSEIVARQ